MDRISRADAQHTAIAQQTSRSSNKSKANIKSQKASPFQSKK